MIFGFIQILFKGFLASCKHIFYTFGEQVSDLNSLLGRVLQLVVGNLSDDLALIHRH